MRILILGGTGFVGTHLGHHFLAQGHTVMVTSQRPQKLSSLKHEVWDGQSHTKLTSLILQADVIINLVGANIAGKRWTTKRKQLILQSRTLSCRALCKSIQTLHDMGESSPQAIIQASACGYYGLWDDMDIAPLCTEASPQGQGFLAQVCAAWEQEMHALNGLNIRLCTTRFAPILGKQFTPSPTAPAKLGGFLASMATPFRFFVGGVSGSGKQPMAWIHMEDVLHGIDKLIQDKNAHGIFNFCAPQGNNMQQFVRTLAKTMHRPHFLPVPSAFIKLALGEMGEELILSGQKPSPEKLLEYGFTFKYPELNQALQQCLKANS